MPIKEGKQMEKINQKGGKDLKKKILTTGIVLALALALGIGGAVFAATTAEVTISATPSAVGISNNSATGNAFDFETVAADTDEHTGNGYFTITNTSVVNIDITIQCTTPWAHTAGSNDWTYGAAAEDTAQLEASSGDSVTGGSTGAGDFDIVILTASATLLMGNVPTTTNPTWELQLDAPTSFTHTDPQECTITLSAAEYIP